MKNIQVRNFIPKGKGRANGRREGKRGIGGMKKRGKRKEERINKNFGSIFCHIKIEKHYSY